MSLVAIVAAGASWYSLQPHPVTVQTTPVVTSYPSQQYVVLNATGYVVAQRKAAIASKASGRLEWLGVAEGSRVKAGDVIARIDNRDVVAQAQSAQANVKAAQAALQQAEVERPNAKVELARSQDLVAKGFVSQVGARHGEHALRPCPGRRRQRAGQRRTSRSRWRATPKSASITR